MADKEAFPQIVLCREVGQGNKPQLVRKEEGQTLDPEIEARAVECLKHIRQQRQLQHVPHE